MLESLRNFISGWVAKILIVLLVAGFALWGVSGSILSGANSTNVAEVGETNVTVRDYLSVYNRSMNDMQRRLGRRLTRDEARLFGIEDRTLSNVVSFAALDEYARVHSLSLSDDMLAVLLAENPQFRDSSGKFNRETFRRAVYEAEMRESDYINLQNASAIRGQVMQSFASGSLLPKAYANALTDFVNEERKFSYITLTAKEAGTPPAPTEAELKTYFDANLKTYAAPEFRKLVILKIEPADIADEAGISDEDVAADYNDRIESYRTPEKRRVQQIVFKSQAEADDAVKTLSEGGLFETVLTDNEVSLADADLGMLAKSQLPKAIQDAAFSLEIGSPSEVLKGPFGPTMIRISESTQETVTPLDDVKADIRKDLALRKATETILDMQETVEDARAGGTSLVDIAKRVGVDERTVEAIDRTARAPDGTIISDLPASRDLLAQAFDTEVGAQASPLDVNNNGYVWYDVASISPARDRTQDEVTDRLLKDWTETEQAKLVDKKAEEVKQRLEKGANLDDVALDLGLLVQTTGFLKRGAEEGDFKRAANQAGFSGDDKFVATVEGATPVEELVVTVVERKGIEARKVETPKEQVEQANQRAADDLLSQMIANLQSKYTVTHNPSVINHALTQGY